MPGYLIQSKSGSFYERIGVVHSGIEERVDEGEFAKFVALEILEDHPVGRGQSQGQLQEADVEILRGRGRFLQWRTRTIEGCTTDSDGRTGH